MPASLRLKIHCPRCQWQVDGAIHWMCSCGWAWNTFDTAGVCPQGQRRWRNTTCPTVAGGCGRTSPHVDWYHSLDKMVDEIMK